MVFQLILEKCPSSLIIKWIINKWMKFPKMKSISTSWVFSYPFWLFSGQWNCFYKHPGGSEQAARRAEQAEGVRAAPERAAGGAAAQAGGEAGAGRGSSGRAGLELQGTVKCSFVFHLASAGVQGQLLLIPVCFMSKRTTRICSSLARSAREPWKRSGRPGWRSCWWRGRSRRHGLSSRGRRRKRHEKMQPGREPGNFAILSLVPFTIILPSKLHLLCNSKTFLGCQALDFKKYH